MTIFHHKLRTREGGVLATGCTCKGVMFCHSLQKHLRTIDLLSCNYCCLPSDFPSKFQSPMTIFHHKLRTREGRVLATGYTCKGGLRCVCSKFKVLDNLWSTRTRVILYVTLRGSPNIQNSIHHLSMFGQSTLWNTWLDDAHPSGVNCEQLPYAFLTSQIICHSQYIRCKDRKHAIGSLQLQGIFQMSKY